MRLARDFPASYGLFDLKYQQVGLMSYRIEEVTDARALIAEHAAAAANKRELNRLKRLAQGEDVHATQRKRRKKSKSKAAKASDTGPKADAGPADDADTDAATASTAESESTTDPEFDEDPEGDAGDPPPSPAAEAPDADADPPPPLPPPEAPGADADLPPPPPPAEAPDADAVAPARVRLDPSCARTQRSQNTAMALDNGSNDNNGLMATIMVMILAMITVPIANGTDCQLRS